MGLLAGLFIVFALLSSFYFPRRDPNFPGNRLGLFVLVTVVLFIGTMAGVVFFAKEEEGAHGAEAVGTHETETGAGARRRPRSRRAVRPAIPLPAGVYASAGCGGCHAPRPPARPATSAPTSTRAARHGLVVVASPTAPARCPRSETSSTSSRSRTSPRTWSTPPRSRTAAIPVPRPERCPSGRRSATGNRTRRKACRGFKSALSVIAQGRNLREQIPTAPTPLKGRFAPEKPRARGPTV